MSAATPPTPDPESWTSDPATRNGARASVRRSSLDPVVVLAYISAVSMPPVGFVLAIVIALGKRSAKARHAVLITAVGILACGMWAVIIASGALTSTNSSF